MMGRYQVRYAPQALEDLKDIYVYIAQELHQRDTAAAQVNRIRAEIRSLDFLPLRYPCVDWEPWQSMGMRKVTVGNFLVFYIPDTQTVTVIRILYAGRDIANLLSEQAAMPPC